MPQSELTAKNELRELRRALHQVCFASLRYGLPIDHVQDALEFVQTRLDFLQSDPESYLADAHGELSPLAQLLGVILYRDMVQS